MTDKQKIEELEQEIEILKTLVLFDPLTGLLTRNGFKDEVLPFFLDLEYSREHPDQRRSQNFKTLSLLFIDIDNFKSVNDTEGHDKGDKVLKRVANEIEKNVRGSDFVGRWGGEEIVVALLGASEGEAKDISEKIRGSVEKETGQTISIGICELADDIHTFDELVKRADTAMYRAKNKGKNCVIMYSEL